MRHRHAFTALAALLLLANLVLAPGAQAHEIRPALLDITETAGGALRVTWKVPTRGNRVLALTPIFPADWVPLGPPSERTVPGAWIQHATYRSGPGSLIGTTLAVEGLSVMQTDVLVRIQLADGTSHSAILRPSAASFRFFRE